jgi:hypothetical protein
MGGVECRRRLLGHLKAEKGDILETEARGGVSNQPWLALAVHRNSEQEYEI